MQSNWKYSFTSVLSIQTFSGFVIDDYKMLHASTRNIFPFDLKQKEKPKDFQLKLKH